MQSKKFIQENHFTKERMNEFFLFSAGKEKEWSLRFFRRRKERAKRKEIETKGKKKARGLFRFSSFFLSLSLFFPAAT